MVRYYIPDIWKSTAGLAAEMVPWDSNFGDGSPWLHQRQTVGGHGFSRIMEIESVYRV